MPAQVGQFWVSQVGFGDTLEQLLLSRLGLRNVPRLNRHVELLSRLDVAVVGQLLNHVDRQSLGLIRGARATQVVDGIWPDVSATTQGLEATKHVVHKVLPLAPTIRFNGLLVVSPLARTKNGRQTSGTFVSEGAITTC